METGYGRPLRFLRHRRFARRRTLLTWNGRQSPAFVPNPKNPRTHSKKQIKQIAASIRKFGFLNPLIVDDENMVLAGHGRLEAARLEGLAEVPIVRSGQLSEAQKRAYLLADNKIALNAGWDEELLALELKELMSADRIQRRTDWLLDRRGRPTDRWSRSGGARRPCRRRRSGSGRSPSSLPPRGRLAAWDLTGSICGDALDPDVVSILMEGEKAEMVFTDPPYNVAIVGNVSGLGKIQHREFAMASGEMTRAEFVAFLSAAFANLVAHSVDGSIHFVCMDWRHMGEMLEAGAANYAELKNFIVWAKDNGGMGAFYRSRHELIFAFKNGAAAHINSFELGQHGRYRTNVWQYRGVNTLKTGRLDELALHPTVKPVAMIADAIKDVSRRSGIVLDLFGGSGSTLIAAHKTGRRARLCELDPDLLRSHSSALGEICEGRRGTARPTESEPAPDEPVNRARRQQQKSQLAYARGFG